MKRKAPKELLAVMRAVARLDSALKDADAVGIAMEIQQRVCSTAIGGINRHWGFQLKLGSADFSVENVSVPEAPAKPLKKVG